MTGQNVYYADVAAVASRDSERNLDEHDVRLIKHAWEKFGLHLCGEGTTVIEGTRYRCEVLGPHSGHPGEFVVTLKPLHEVG